MKTRIESKINRCVELIILFSSMLVIALMITGGCGGDGGQKGQPGPTGPPPGCENIDIDPDCPAVSVTELCDFWGYSCNFTEKNSQTPEPETISIGVLPSECITLDCFTLECEESFEGSIPAMSIITLDIVEIEIISDIVPAAFSGIADINGDEFDYVCLPPMAIP